MRTSLRRTYFIRLTLLIFASYLLILFLFALYEWHEYKGYPPDEIIEFMTLMSLMGLTIPFVLLAAWSIAGHLLKPLREVLTAAERIRAGNLDERVPVQKYGDELGRLADTINDAFDRYADAVERLKNFSADASHQLRTPLAIIRSNADIALQRERSPAEYRETLGSILEHAVRLQRIMDQLLQLSRLDRPGGMPMEDMDLDALHREWIGEIAPLFQEQDIAVEYRAPAEAVRVRGSSVLLKEALTNVLNNASQHTPPGGRVVVSVARTPGHRAEWRVEDSGPGIPATERERVLQRFYRGRDTSDKPGAGLGLAIVHDIIRMHKGDLRIEQSADLGGAAVVMHLPLADYSRGRTS